VPSQPRVEATEAITADTGIRDEFDEYLTGQLQDPAFALAWHRLGCSRPGPLCIDGHEYRRRQQARRRRRR